MPDVLHDQDATLDECHRLPAAAKLRQLLGLRPTRNMHEFRAGLVDMPAEAFGGDCN